MNAISCRRCGNSIEDKGCTICEDCLKRLCEKIVLCPIHQIEMKKKLVWDTIIDQCPICGGIWLDHNELKIIEKSIVDGYQDKYIEGFSIGLAVRK